MFLIWCIIHFVAARQLGSQDIEEVPRQLGSQDVEEVPHLCILV